MAHHRKKRFHVPREALGKGYSKFDLLARASADNQAPSAPSDEQEPVSLKEESNRTARKGLWTCLLILALVIAATVVPYTDKFMKALIACVHILSRFWEF